MDGLTQRIIGLLLLTLGSLGCTSMDGRARLASDYPERRAGGLRVAAMPFDVSVGDDDAISSTLAPLASLLALEGLSDDAPVAMVAGGVMQRAVVALLASSALAIEEQWITRSELAHAGFSMQDLQDRKRSSQIASLLHVDAILFGEVYEWDRSYYGVQATQSVGLRVWLVDGATGEELAFAERWRQEGTGITGGPTGYVSIATAPIQGLAGSTLASLAIQVAYDVTEDLLGGAPPESFATANVRGTLPKLAVVAADPLGGDGLKADQRLSVVAIGSSGGQVSFGIGAYRTRIPMIEVDTEEDSRGDRSTYVGSYVVQAGESLDAAPIHVHIERKLSDGRVVFGETKTIVAGRVVIAAR